MNARTLSARPDRMPCGTSQAALTSFDDTNSKELEIEVVTQEVTRLFREAEKQLQRFGHQQSATAADDKVRRVSSVEQQTEKTIAHLCKLYYMQMPSSRSSQHFCCEHLTIKDDDIAMGLQVRRNVQRTLATELQNLSVQFRKQQKQHLNQLRQQKEGVSGSWLDAGPSGDAGDEYDPGFSDMQVRFAPAEN
jgi:syntaxin 16